MARNEDITQAALRLFVTRGFHAVGVDEIGAVAGVAGPAIYRHFKGKQALLAHIFEQAMDLLLDGTGGGPERNSTQEFWTTS